MFDQVKLGRDRVRIHVISMTAVEVRALGLPVVRKLNRDQVKHGHSRPEDLQRRHDIYFRSGT